MKRICFSRVLAMVMMLAMMIGAFAGCGAKKTDEELIVGKWETAIDFQKAMEEGMDEGNAEMLSEIDFSGITMKLNAEFKADGTYALELDKASAETAMKQMVEKLVPALKEMLRQELAEGSEEEITDEQLDEMLAYFGVDSWDALGDLFIQEMDTDAMFNETGAEGKYLIKEGKLYLSKDADSDPAAENGAAYTVNSKTLTLKLDGSEDVPDFMKELTFNRVG